LKNSAVRHIVQGTRSWQRAIKIASIPFSVYMAGCSSYLLTLTAAALLKDKKTHAHTLPNQPRFTILIPAHNEAGTLPRLLSSIAALDYPRDRIRVLVIADNCSDTTAAVARAAGANVLERANEIRIGKGYALESGIEEILKSRGDEDDGVLIVDADSELSTNFLTICAYHLSNGASVVQSYYSVNNGDDSPVAMLRYTALCLYNFLRLRGRSRLGLSVGLRGNGMCFRKEVLRETGWHAFGLTEDVEQHFRLLQQGIRVRFAGDAIVRAEMPVALRDAVVQNSRWERGRLLALRADVPRFLALALSSRDLSALDAAAEQLVPPLSVCLAGGALLTGIGIASGSRLAIGVGLGSLLGQTAYVLAGLRLTDAPSAAYRSLARAPVYVIWKLWVWVRAVVRPPSRWQRTRRLAEISAQPYAHGQE
jgi:cellulose synthase/poly-beta-1,6-N-acetylglucosamine synthase-like glycosyltransferase